MALSVTIRKTVSIGGNLKITYGTWSGAAGDSAGTFTVAGGDTGIYGYQFFSQDSGGDEDLVPVRVSGTAGVLTVSVENLKAVTAGRFHILHT